MNGKTESAGGVAHDWGGPEKPAYGSPCNGCGLCCIAEQCPIGALLLGEADLCPALTQMGNVKVCGLVADTKRYFNTLGRAELDTMLSNAIGYVLGAGRGCDALMAGEEEPPGARERFEALRDLPTGMKAMDLIARCMVFLKNAPGAKKV